MIQSDRELAMARKWRDDFQNAMNKTLESVLDPMLKQLYLDTQQSTIQAFNDDIEEYESKGPINWEKQDEQ